ncbi:MAG: ABC transporter ATP-binding protein [bacterium]
MIELRSIDKSYWRASEEVKALRGVSLTIDHAEFVAVLGASGSGKSTLLNIIGGLDFPDTGEVIIGGQRLHTMKDRDLTLFRRKRIGYIFQFFNLFPHLTVWENVAIPLLLDGEPPKKARTKAEEILFDVGLIERMHHLPQTLSGGEMQRVAISRAMITKPEILLADEPTGNLDSHMGERILNLIKELSTHYKRTVILVSHDHRSADYAERCVQLQDGQVVTPVVQPS